MSTSFEFQYPWLLALLALLPLYAFLRGQFGAEAAIPFSSAEIIERLGTRVRAAGGRLLIFLRLAVLALAIVALAGPRRVNDQTETQSSGVDILLVLDLSWSMMALDMGGEGERITRFDIAQKVLKDFIERRPADRIGLVCFSGVPYFVSPLTLNHDWIRMNLDRLHIGMIRELGTAIGDATAMAVKRIAGVKDSKSRIIIVLTDGDNNKGELDPIPAAEVARAMKARLYTIGIGKDEPTPLPSFDTSTGHLRLDAFKQPMLTSTILQPANYSVLGKMAEIGSGRFYRATNRQELESIYDDIDRLERTEVKLKHHRTYTPLFVWPLLGAFALLITEQVLAHTRYRRVP
ncbi:MAG: VWA domain-containing protein [Chthoniobacteraceae bacterium]